MKREELINNILDIKETIYFIREETEDYTAVTEYDSIYGDICEYEEDNFEEWTIKELKDYIKYLREEIVEDYMMNREDYMINRGEN